MPPLPSLAVCLTALAVLAAPLHAAADPSPPVALSNVHRVGRFDVSDPSRPAFTWPGTSLHTRVRGGTVSIRLKAPRGVHFEVLIDDASVGTFKTKKGEHSYPLRYPASKGALPASYNISVYRRNEGRDGVVQFVRFEPAAGASLEPSPPPYAHKLEFIGDSITCGYGVEGAPGCKYSSATESAYKSYAAVAARRVNAGAHLVAYSGKGLVQNWGGGKNQPMKQLYGRTLTNNANGTWDFSRYTPDAVIINLGTNDFSSPIEPEIFSAAYVALMRRVRGHYPKAHIFAIRWGHWPQSGRKAVSAAVATFADPATHELLFRLQKNEPFGCDGHPGEIAHQRLGEQLSAALKQTLGW